MKKFLLSIIVVSGLIAAVPQVSFAVETNSQTTTSEIMSTSDTATEPAHEAEADDSIVGMFGLNWKLFLAQLVNFGIVLFVLWKWVWKPVTSNMEARTKKIEDSLLNADQITKDKEEFDSWRNTEISKARQEAMEIINTAKQQAEVVKTEVVEQTKAEQQSIIERAQQELEQQKVKMLQEAQGELAEIVVRASEKLLRSKLDSKTDQKLINQALKEV